MASVAGAFRRVANGVFSVRTLNAPASRVVTAALVRELSYDAGQSPPWSEFGDGGGGHGAMRGSNSRPRRGRDRRPGDWDCNECGNHVFATRTVCPRCQAPKPYDEGIGRVTTHGHSQRTLPGDWICPNCDFHNFANRHECYRCQEPKPPGVEVFSKPNSVAGTGTGWG